MKGSGLFSALLVVLSLCMLAGLRRELCLLSGSLRGFKDVAEEGAVGGVQGPVLAQSLCTGRTMKKPLLVLKGPFAGWDDSASRGWPSILSALRGGGGERSRWGAR